MSLCCKKCGSENFHKSGFMSGKQRYRCRDCDRHFTDTPKRGKPDELKKQALHLYLEGMGLRAIGRFLGVSNVAVLKWIRNFGELALYIHENTPPPEKAEIVEIDELWHYAQKKNMTDGYGLLSADIRCVFLTGLSATVLFEREEKSGQDSKR